MGNAGATQLSETTIVEQLIKTTTINLGDGTIETIDGNLTDDELISHLYFNQDIINIYSSSTVSNITFQDRRIPIILEDIETLYNTPANPNLGNISLDSLPNQNLLLVADNWRSSQGLGANMSDVEVLIHERSQAAESAQIAREQAFIDVQDRILTELLKIEQEFVDECEKFVNSSSADKAKLEDALARHEKAFQTLENLKKNNADFIATLEANGVFNADLIQDITRLSYDPHVRGNYDQAINETINAIRTYVRDAGLIRPSADYPEGGVTIGGKTIPGEVLSHIYNEAKTALDEAQTAEADIPAKFHNYYSLKSGKNITTNQEALIRIAKIVAVEVVITIGLAFLTGGTAGVARLILSAGRALRSTREVPTILATREARAAAARRAGIAVVDEITGVPSIIDATKTVLPNMRRASRIDPDNAKSITGPKPRNIVTTCASGTCQVGLA